MATAEGTPAESESYVPSVRQFAYSRHYELHEQGDPELAREELKCHYCQFRKFTTHNSYPTYYINDVDDDFLPKSFTFIQENILREGVEVAADEFRSGCECKSIPECQRKRCHCLQELDIDPDTRETQKIYAYHTVGDNAECLRSRVLESRQPIYECHDKCACDKATCSNQVVGRGRKLPLQIFKTDDGRGWGVRSTIDIQKGQYVDKYVGEVITAEEAHRRRLNSDVAQRKDVYLFALDKFSDPDSPDPRLSGPPLEVDGEFFSGPTRFINHSCDPNLRIFARVGDHADKHLHDLAFFALKDIEPEEELTFDYVDGKDDAGDELDPEKRKNMAICLCGSDNCRGYLW